MEVITAVAILAVTFFLGYFARSLDEWIARKIDDPEKLKKITSRFFWGAFTIMFVFSAPIIGLIMIWLEG